MDSTNLYAAASSDGHMRTNSRHPDAEAQPYGQVSAAAYGANQKKTAGETAGGENQKTPTATP